MDDRLLRRLRVEQARALLYDADPHHAVTLACDLLVAGIDGDAVVALAAESARTLPAHDANRRLAAVTAELGLPTPDADEISPSAPARRQTECFPEFRLPHTPGLGRLRSMDAGKLDGCVLVTGMPGAGKSTVTALAARLLPRAARVTGEEMNMMVVSGRVGFQCEPADESARQAELCTRNMCTLAANFVDYGFTTLVDTVVANRAALDFMLGLLAPRPVRLVILAPGIDACTYRNLHRDPEDQFFFNGYPQLEADMRRDLADLGWWFDTSARTPQETAERLVADAARHRVLT